MPETVRYLTFAEVEQINREAAGSGAGVRDRRGIEGVLGRPKATYEGVELVPDLHDKAATLFHGFATTQYFFDGNKRTSFLSATAFLAVNRWAWIPTVDLSNMDTSAEADDIRADALQTFIEAVADEQYALSEIGRYLREHSREAGRNYWAMTAQELEAQQDALQTLADAIQDGLFTDREIRRIVAERASAPR